MSVYMRAILHPSMKTHAPMAVCGKSAFMSRHFCRVSRYLYYFLGLFVFAFVFVCKHGSINQSPTEVGNTRQYTMQPPSQSAHFFKGILACSGSTVCRATSASAWERGPYGTVCEG